MFKKKIINNFILIYDSFVSCMNCDVLSIGVFNIVILDVWVCDVIIYMLVEWIVFYKNWVFFVLSFI